MATAEKEKSFQDQADEFLEKWRLTFRAEWKDADCPPWEKDDPAARQDHVHGDHYRITLRRHTGRPELLSFDFWNSFNDMREGKAPTAYDALSCIGSDIYTPETFEDFCSEYGYDTDSRGAERTFKRADRLARRLRAFFHEDERADLEAIR